MTSKTTEKDHVNKLSVGARDKHGDFIAEAPNPVNPNPQNSSDYPPPQRTTTKIQEMPQASSIDAQSPAINRPPKQPAHTLGPYYQFINTDLNKMLWLGSALILHHVSLDRPKIEFTCKPKIDFNWELLYDNIFGMRIYRVNISIELRNGEGDDEINWKIDWNANHQTEGLFRIARYNQNWRGGFFSCNGFDASVPELKKSKIKSGNVWEHLNTVHDEKHLHLLIWGGDQNYIDFIFEDIPYLKEWVDMDWNTKWTCDFRDDLREQIEQYHFNAYLENWERPEVRNALASIPSIMMWDDHDIFDGAGSYPPLLHDSPMMSGLFKTAQKMRLLFQHHTTFEKVRDHGLFGYQSYNFLTFCGPNLALVGSDDRSERTTEQVKDARSWDIIFEKLDKHIIHIQHLIVIFPVPFSIVRFKLAENCFEHFKNLPNRCRNLPLVKQTNSIFGLPELYDDLLDEWTHEAHINERNQVLQRFQQLAEKKRVRVTFFSGDVHCCGISRFKTHDKQELAPLYDSKLMYQIISSAIVNLPPPPMAIYVAHKVQTKWYPIEKTVEEMIDFFQHVPETGKNLRHKKFLPNRNWCYFEQCDPIDTTMYSPVETVSFQHCCASKNRTVPIIELDPTLSNTSVQQNDRERMNIHSLKIRLWIESTEKHREGRDFVSYDLLIPNLV